MNKYYVDQVWRLLVVAVVEVLNPLLLISLALFVSVGYILTLLLPVNVDIWASLVVVCVLCPLILLSIRARSVWRSESQAQNPFSWRALLPIAPLPILLLAQLVMLSHPSLLSFAHIDQYFAYVIQAYHGVTPLENVFVPGHPANHYWLFFALIAAIVRLTYVDTLSVMSVLNFVYLASALLWLGRTIQALNLAAPRTIYLGIAVIFVFGALNATGPLSNLSHIFGGSFELGNLRDTLLPGADRRLHATFVKVFNASAMTLGITAFTAALFACVKMLRGRVDMLALVLISAGGIATLGVMPVVTLFAVCVLLASVALSAIFFWRKSTGRISEVLEFFWLTVERLNPLAVVVWLAVSLMLSIPLLHYFGQFTGNYQSGMSFVLLEPINVRMTIAASVLLLPLVGLQIASALGDPAPSRVYLAFCSISGLFLVIGVVGPDQNQYKLQYLLCMIFALAALLLVEQCKQRSPGLWVGVLQAYVAGLTVLALLNSAYGLYTVVAGVVSRSGSASFRGIHIQSNDDFGGRLPAFYWIRDNTPTEAIIIVPPAYTTRSALFHERLNYVREKRYYFVDNIPAYDNRVNQLHVFYDRSTTQQMIDSLVMSIERELPGRPFYAVVMYSEIEPAQMNERGARIAFDSPEHRVAVYLLNP